MLSVSGIGMTRMMKSAIIASTMSDVNKCAWLTHFGLAPLIAICDRGVSDQYAEIGLQTIICDDT